MQFGTLSGAPKELTNKEIKSEKEELISEINSYALQLEEIKGLLSEYTIKKEDIVLLDKIISEKENDIAEKTAVLESMKGLITEYQSLKKDKEALESDISKLDETISTKKSSIEELESLYKETKQKQERELGEVTDSINEIKKQAEKEDAIRNAYELDRTHIEEINKNLMSQKETLETDISYIIEKVDQEEFNLADVKEKISEETLSLKKLETSTDKAQTKLTETKSLIEKEKEEFSIFKNGEMEKLNEREGEISMKTQWLEEKRANLIFAKEQVEKELGRPLNIKI